ncbi:hypothetical protein [Iodobacter fluviatilis]|uniref:hypothetical protein n=1 Tax=Iodobacter fluviatilis TaxID=537 RepID=UPI000E1BA615|nr:hypothetical protein [Iodobacter fluviatilis]
MILINFIGIALLLVGLGIPAMASSALHLSHEASLVVTGVLLVAMDVTWRLIQRGENSWRAALALPKQGGSIFFLPVWLWGGWWIGLGMYRLVFASQSS